MSAIVSRATRVRAAYCSECAHRQQAARTQFCLPLTHAHTHTQRHRTYFRNELEHALAKKVILDSVAQRPLSMLLLLSLRDDYVRSCDI